VFRPYDGAAPFTRSRLSRLPTKRGTSHRRKRIQRSSKYDFARVAAAVHFRTADHALIIPVEPLLANALEYIRKQLVGVSTRRIREFVRRIIIDRAYALPQRSERVVNLRYYCRCDTDDVRWETIFPWLISKRKENVNEHKVHELAGQLPFVFMYAFINNRIRNATSRKRYAFIYVIERRILVGN